MRAWHPSSDTMRGYASVKMIQELVNHSLRSSGDPATALLLLPTVVSSDRADDDIPGPRSRCA